MKFFIFLIIKVTQISSAMGKDKSPVKEHNKKEPKKSLKEKRAEKKAKQDAKSRM